MKKVLLAGVLLVGLLAGSGVAQAASPWNGMPPGHTCKDSGLRGRTDPPAWAQQPNGFQTKYGPGPRGQDSIDCSQFPGGGGGEPQ